MSIVVDSSVASSWALPDEFSDTADTVLAKLAETEMLVPQLFWYEIRNVLIVNERRGRIDAMRSANVLAFVATLSCRVDQEHNEDALLSLARKHGLTVYDASYLELAVRSGAPLATLDRKLENAAVAESVSIVKAAT